MSDERADRIIEEGIHSHIVWRDFLMDRPDYPTNDVGDVERHTRWIKDYEYLRSLLHGMGWTCFHCGETFTIIGLARAHFGPNPDTEPGCAVRVGVGEERGLLMALRGVEQERDELKVRLMSLRLGADENEAAERFLASREDAA